MTGIIGDWIIKGIAGEFYPCKNEIFEKTYEPVDSSIQEGEERMFSLSEKQLLNLVQAVWRSLNEDSNLSVNSSKQILEQAGINLEK
jgi:hypothetical protein